MSVGKFDLTELIKRTSVFTALNLALRLTCIVPKSRLMLIAPRLFDSCIVRSFVLIFMVVKAPRAQRNVTFK